MKTNPDMIMEERLCNIIHEMAKQRNSIQLKEGHLTFDEEIEQMLEFSTHSEPGLAFQEILFFLRDGNFILSGVNALSLAAIGITLGCQVNDEGEITVDI